MATTIRVRIGGMTCVRCQDKIEKTLRRTKGVISAGVSYARATADIVYDEETVSSKDLIAVIERMNYEVIPGDTPAGNIVNSASLLAIIVSLYLTLQSLGILNRLAPSQLADTTMGYGMLFVIGLMTSVHCVAMCGGINLSQCLPTRGQPSGKPAPSRPILFRPALAYNMGRLASYTVVGFVLGLVGLFLSGGSGAGVGLSLRLQGTVKIIAGLVMVRMGITMLGLFPWLRTFTLHIPRCLTVSVGNDATRPLFVGVLNGFMPCGPLQSMWIVALATGNPFVGALSMFLFSLGTIPLMLGFGSIVSALGRTFTNTVMTVGAVFVVILGLAMLSQGGSLSGWLPPDLLLVLVIALATAGLMLSIPIETKAVGAVIKAASLAIVIGAYVLWRFQGALIHNGQPVDNIGEIVNGVQMVNSSLASGRYPTITVQKGIPVKWIIDAPKGSINGCNNRILIQDYGIEHRFHIGKNIIEFTPIHVGTVSYSCWMGMIHGNIIITDATLPER